jgi:predicted SAM-dependent methyltransferase
MGREDNKKLPPKMATTKNPEVNKKRSEPKVESKKQPKGLLSDPGCLRLNLGSGSDVLSGYDNIDRMFGTEVYPLDYEDGSVAEIRASHILEHFSHRVILDVLENWVSKLEPGGVLKIAVPDFLQIVGDYLKGTQEDMQGYIMGGHVDENDIHQTIFDEEVLRDAMVSSGLVRIKKWESTSRDIASGKWSLNLVGYKPSHEDCGILDAGIEAILGAPRFGPVTHMQCAFQAFHKLRIPYKIIQGCFWHHNLCVAMQMAVDDPNTNYVLTCDYDTVFDANDVLELYRLMLAYPNIDAICGLQGKRDLKNVLISMKDINGDPVSEVPSAVFLNNVLEVSTGHFGLTLFKADALRDFPKPWMNDVPNEKGEWKDGQIDADISFWKKWRDEYGKKLYLAPKVVLGHHVEVVMWPDPKMNMVYQTTSDYNAEGQPPEIAR